MASSGNSGLLVSIIVRAVYYPIALPILAISLIAWIVRLLVVVVTQAFLIAIRRYNSGDVPQESLDTIQAVAAVGSTLVSRLLHDPMERPSTPTSHAHSLIGELLVGLSFIAATALLFFAKSYLSAGGSQVVEMFRTANVIPLAGFLIPGLVFVNLVALIVALERGRGDDDGIVIIGFSFLLSIGFLLFVIGRAIAKAFA